uniref:DUF4283 domain-containing protein n=1 Tax=Gossypium raimondii TaxID=29730 RepID=A0A0D2QVK2_GOSRA|nr:hypothetical protein B456_007G189100 [Gossypium raimondii]
MIPVGIESNTYNEQYVKRATTTLDEFSLEEQDHLERSTKKIRAVDVVESLSPAPPSQSYKESLLKPLVSNDLFQGACSVKDDDDDSDSDMEELSDEFASISVVELLEKLISYKTLTQWLTSMWNLDEEFDCIDLGHGFYVVKISSVDDGLKVITTGTWKIMDHYLTIQKWKSNCHPAIRMIVSTVVWTQLPSLPLEYFNEEVLVKGKFARICVEIDLCKPLIPSIRIGNFIQNIEYKGLHDFFSYGCFEHRTEA